jgi:glutathione S-transferase
MAENNSVCGSSWQPSAPVSNCTYEIQEAGDSSKPEAILGYWNIRGIGQPLRYALIYTNTPFKEYRYQQGDKQTDYDISSWIKDKTENLHQLDFPNLPYFVQGDIKITQSHAILRHICRANNLLGDSQTERAAVDMMLAEAADLTIQLARVVYMEKDFPSALAAFEQRLPQLFNLLSKYLGQKKFLVKDTVTAPDFFWCEYLDVLNLMLPGSYRAHQNLVDYLARFQNLERIAAYRKSKHFIERPLNNLVASWM